MWYLVQKLDASTIAQPRRSRSCGRAGFTIFELLAVITLLTVLLTLLLPSLQDARYLAKNAKCLSQLKQLGMALHLYATDFRGYMMPAWEYPPEDYGHTSSYYGLMDNGSWREIVMSGENADTRYGYYRDMIHCAVDPDPFLVPDDDASKYNFTYAVNVELAGHVEPNRLQRRIASVGGHKTYIMGSKGHLIYYWSWLLEYPASGNLESVETKGDRHRGAVNNLFVDGSASRLTFEEILTGDVVMP